jgi:modulator of FtsH protease HflC
MNRLYILLGGIAVALVVLLSSIFVVDERERALVLQFGQIKRVVNEPGLGFKIPFLQEIVRYDDRIQSLETQLIEVTPSDDRRLEIDAFMRWRIDDLRQFRLAVGSGGLDQARQRLESILTTQVRSVLGADQVTSNTILSAERAVLMTRIRDLARTQAAALGVTVIDVRLKQTNLPSQNLVATFDRMRAERLREATDERARGGEAAQRVTAQADRTVVEITSEAQREAEIIRGQADADRNRIFAEAYGQDPEFFAFYRSLAAYGIALKAGNTTLVMSPDGEFFDYLKDADLAPEPPPQ